MIIDFHTHVGDLRRSQNEPRLPVTWENLIERLDDEGIDKAVLLPVPASPENTIGRQMLLGERVSIPEQVLDAACYPDRIIPFGNLDPRWLGNSSKSDFTPLLEWFIEHGCKGIGEVTANIPFDDLRVVNMFRQIGAARLPVLFHGIGMGKGTYGLQDEPGAPRLERLLREAPETTIVGHGQGFWAEIAAGLSPEEKMGYPKGPIKEEGALPRLLRQYPNLYADISAGSGYNALTRDSEYGVAFINEFQDRLLFGTDVCFGDEQGRMPHLRHLKDLLAEGKISQAVFDNITCGNALKIL